MKKKLKQKVEQESMVKKPFVWGELLTNKSIDLMIVILGVTIAFQLNNWKLSRDQQSLETFYKESLTTDLQKDVYEEEEILKSLKHDKAVAEAYLKAANPAPDSLAKTIVTVLTLETFSGHQNTYQTLLQGNALSTLSDRELRNQITEYYSSYTSIRRFEDVYTSALFKVYDYFSPYCNFEKVKLTDTSVLSKTQTRNSLIIVMSQLNDGIEAHSEALQKAQALVKGL